MSTFNLTDFDVHVCLVSGQPTPNLMPILAYKPKEVVLVVTPQATESAHALQSQIEKATKAKVQIININNQFDMKNVEDQLFELLAIKDKSKIILNATGGTKLMAFAALDLFRKLGYPAFYFDSNHIYIFNANANSVNIQVIDEQLKIRTEDYLAAHGFAVLNRPQRQINQTWFPIAKELIQSHHRFSDALGALNAAISKATEHHKNKLDIHLDKPFTSLQTLLASMKDVGLITIHDNKHTIEFASIEARDYIAGKWFEEYTFDLIKRIPNIQDCAMGVQVDLPDKNERAHNELDITIMMNGNLHILECKTVNYQSKNLDSQDRTHPLYKLQSLEKLGGERTRLAFVSYRPLPAQMKQRANGAKIELFEQKDLLGLQKHLNKWLDTKSFKL